MTETRFYEPARLSTPPKTLFSLNRWTPQPDWGHYYLRSSILAWWSLCAFSQAFLVNSLMWRVRGKDHERRNYFVARNNEAQGLDMLRPKSFQLALAVQTLDSAIHRINHYPSDRSPWSRASISTDFLSQPLPSSMPPDPPRYSCFSDHGLLAKVKAPA